MPIELREAHDKILLHRDKVIAHRDPDAHKKGVRGNELPIVSKGNDLFIPTTSLAMDGRGKAGWSGGCVSAIDLDCWF